jgi:betaine reductase
MIGPRVAGYDDLEWIETGDCDADVATAMEAALRERKIDGAVALHYPFPMGVTTIGRVLTPARGKDMIVASSTGTSAIHRTEAMLLNALYGIAVAKAIGKKKPTVGVLNVEGAQLVFRALSRLKENGYEIAFGASVRKDGGAVLRGNDILAGAVDVCVNDTLTGNVLMKMFSSYANGGSFEALGLGYGPFVRRMMVEGHIDHLPRFRGSRHRERDRLQRRVRARRPPRLWSREIAAAKKAGLDDVIAELAPKLSATEEKITPRSCGADG